MMDYSTTKQKGKSLLEKFKRQARLLTLEHGVTLIEMVVAIGLTTVIASAAALSITTIIRFTEPVNGQAIATQQVQNAGSWLTRDIHMSRVELGDGNPVLVTLTQPQDPLDPSSDITVVYNLEAMPGGSYRLVREEPDAGKRMVIAENIQISIEEQTDTSGIPTYAITITSSPQGPRTKEVHRYYQVTPRLPQD